MRFNGMHLAEIFGLREVNENEYSRGFITVEVIDDKYVLWRDMNDGKSMEVEFSTTDPNTVASYLEIVNTYEFCGWFRTYEQVKPFLIKEVSIDSFNLKYISNIA